MAHTIGGVTCEVIRGTPQKQLNELASPYRVKGHDGYATIETGKGGGAFRLRAKRFAAQATLEAWIRSMGNLQGSDTISVVYDAASWDRTFTNILIKNAIEVPESRMWVKHEGTWKVTCWLMLDCLLVI